MNFWLYFILFFFPLAGGSIGLMVREHKLNQLKIFLAFSGAFLFSITAINLLPEVYAHGGVEIGYFIIGGFLLQILIDTFSKGVEHGHLHVHELQSVPYGIFIALSLHAFLEGMAVGSEFFEPHVQRNLVYGIALHEIPAAFALIILLKATKIRKRYLYIWLIAYSCMTLFGAGFYHFFLAPYTMRNLDIHNINEVLPYLIAVVIGVFLHISTTILFENSENHRFSRYKLLAIACGVLIAVLSGQVHFH